jgi:hypothetical protein
MVVRHPREDPLRGRTLPGPRTRDVGGVDLWWFIPDEDRRVLTDAGLCNPARTIRLSRSARRVHVTGGAISAS